MWACDGQTSPLEVIMTKGGFRPEPEGNGRPMSYQYDNAFFDFVNASSGKSASRFLGQFVPAVLGGQNPASVLDVGCGRGVWLAEWKRLGVATLQGLDGEYVDRKSLLIPADQFLPTDISVPIDLQRRFELVECLEVAEHVPESHAETLVDNLVRHGDLILFSAAIPGQGGEFHVNERPYSYWRQKFAARGYAVYDAIRPQVAGLREIEPWYRYNALVYANDAGSRRLSETASGRLVPAEQQLVDVAPLYWRLRCAAIAALPNSATSMLARLKHRASNLSR
jgi:SAM-dependent methyltransferase